MGQNSTLFERIGGRETLERVHKHFYDLVYKDPWIGLYFQEVPQETIENQQSDFMMKAMGGANRYCGKLPIPAHRHMFITNELFDLRTRLLREAIRSVGLSPELEEEWIKIDNAFRKGIVKNSLNDCQKRFETDEIANFSPPISYKKSA